jgi:Immunity protein Imm1
MRIQDYDSVCDVTAPADIERALSKRHGGHNEFWLSHGTSLHPAMSILVNGDLGYIGYFPSEGHPGYASVGDLESGDQIVFYVGPTENIWADSGAVIPFSDALKAAQEFSVATLLPKSIQWFEL